MNRDEGAEWSGLSDPWREAFELARESFVAGSPTVGAVVVAQDGSIVSRGRNRRAELDAPVGQLAGSRLSHAEVNALAQLPVESDRQLALLVTLELGPLLKQTASVVAVCFANADQVYTCLWSQGPVHIHFVVQAETRGTTQQFGAHGPKLQASMFELNEAPMTPEVEHCAERARDLFVSAS